MNINSFTKKLLGTFVIVSIIAIGLTATTTDAFAQFLDFGSYLKVDGVVDEADSSHIVLLTSGSDPIDVTIND